MGYVDGFRHDVFISYAHIDDAPELWKDGWVKTFRIKLQASIQQHLGLMEQGIAPVVIGLGADVLQ